MSTFGFYPEFPQVTGVGNPSAGFARLYLHEDGTVRRRNSDGSETILQAGTSGGSSFTTGDFFLGDGSDGDVIISSNTTLTRNMFYENLTVNAGATLFPAGFFIYVRGTLTVNGSISASGGNGGNGVIISSSGAGGGGAGGVAVSGGQTGGIGAGTGSNATSTPPNLGVRSPSFGGAGGLGGNGAARNAALVGAITRPTAVQTAYAYTLWFLSRIEAFGVSNFNISQIGGGGGTGGGIEKLRVINTGIGAGGGGGGGGGIFIASKNITGTGNIQSRGGNGGNALNISPNPADTAGDLGAACGGGGGGGGVIIIGSATAPTSINNTTGVGNIGGVSLSVEGGVGGLHSQHPFFPAANGENGQPGTIIISR